jgi:hypothetical protein
MATTIFPTPAGIVGVLADADVAFSGDGEAKFIAHLGARKSRGQKLLALFLAESMYS